MEFHLKQVQGNVLSLQVPAAIRAGKNPPKPTQNTSKTSLYHVLSIPPEWNRTSLCSGNKNPLSPTTGEAELCPCRVTAVPRSLGSLCDTSPKCSGDPGLHPSAPAAPAVLGFSLIFLPSLGEISPLGTGNFPLSPSISQSLDVKCGDTELLNTPKIPCQAAVFATLPFLRGL